MVMIEDDDRLSVSTADDLARMLTDDRVRIRVKGEVLTLWCEGERATVHLLPYQLTEHGIATVIAENEPWPNG